MGKGYREGWGLERHGAGSNYFHYIRDPWKSLLELTCDADYIAKGCTWEAGDLDLAQAVMQWGPAPPPDFINNYEWQTADRRSIGAWSGCARGMSAIPVRQHAHTKI